MDEFLPFTEKNINNQQVSNDHVFLKNKIPSNLEQESFIEIDRSKPYLIYSIGFQPAKSIPEIPAWCMNKYLKDRSKILEPFSGSGTTVMEAIKNGHDIYWYDLNPVSRLNTSLKFFNAKCDILMDEFHELLKRINKTTKYENTVKISNYDFWFQKEVQEILEKIKLNIKKIRDDIQLPFWVAFALAARKASDSNDGMILASRRSNYKEVPKKNESDVLGYFRNYFIEVINAVEEWSVVLKKIK